MRRREFVRRAALGAGVFTAGGMVVGAGCEGTPTVVEPTVRPPLRMPPEMPGTGELVAAPGASLNLGNGRSAAGWGFNGALPGPTIRVRRGDPVDLRLLNALAQETTIHWHGLVLPPEMDGHPRDAVGHGESFRYAFPVQQRAGLAWYHPHPHHRVGEQVARGLAGFFVVNDAEEDALGLPAGPREVPLAIRDARLGSGGELDYRRRDDGFRGDFPLVNGTVFPELEVDTAVYRFRILNASNSRVFDLALSSGEAAFVVIGNDGGLIPRAEEVGTIRIGPAERVDVLVDLRVFDVGDRVAIRCTRSGWDLLVLRVVRMTNDLTAMPSALSVVHPFEGERISRERTFAFEGHHRINGTRYDLSRVDFRVPFGETELWRFVSRGGAPHPVHVHGTHFQVVSRTGGRGRVFPWERGWKDTVLLEERETVETLVRFDAHRGLYLMHCHRLEHEDGGMMLNFEVT